jgi:hypothetical protein
VHWIPNLTTPHVREMETGSESVERMTDSSERERERGVGKCNGVQWRGVVLDGNEKDRKPSR